MAGDAGEERDVPVAGLRLDGGTQLRAGLDEDAVQRYQDAYEAGRTLPPVDVFDDGKSLWLADGFTRAEARRRAKFKTINCLVRKGTLRDARIHAAGANEEHGLPRDARAREAAVRLLLADPELAELGSRPIAEMAKVSHVYVQKVRRMVEAELEAAGQPPLPGHELPAPGPPADGPGEEDAPDDAPHAGASCGGDGGADPESGGADESGEDESGDRTPRDRLGAPLPARLRDMFASAMLKQNADHMRNLLKVFNDLKLKWLCWVRPTAFMHLEQLPAMLEEAIPYAVCVGCAGEGCPKCRKSGFVPKWRYEELASAGKWTGSQA